MATQLFLRNNLSDITIGGTDVRELLATRGTGSVNKITDLVNGGTDIAVTEAVGQNLVVWMSPPITSGFTLSGTVTVNIRGLESHINDNAGRGILIQRCNNAGTVQSDIVANTTVPSSITEYTTSDAANGSATYTPTSTSMSAGDRIKVTLKVRNVGSMTTGTVTNSIDGPTAGAAGDTWVQFNENFNFTHEGARTEAATAGESSSVAQVAEVARTEAATAGESSSAGLAFDTTRTEAATAGESSDYEFVAGGGGGSAKLWLSITDRRWSP